MIGGHDCKKIQINIKNPKTLASLSELYMGTYEQSGKENGLPKWFSLSAEIWFDGAKWLISDIKKHGTYRGTLVDYGQSEWPTQNITNWKLINNEAKLIPLNDDISVQCTGNTIFF